MAFALLASRAPEACRVRRARFDLNLSPPRTTQSHQHHRHAPSMAPSALYRLRIRNEYTDHTHAYEVTNVAGLVAGINAHYGLKNMITRDGVRNLMVRGHERSPKRFGSIHIERIHKSDALPIYDGT